MPWSLCYKSHVHPSSNTLWSLSNGNNGSSYINMHKIFYASSISVNTPLQSLGCKNITGFPCAPILGSAPSVRIFIALTSATAFLISLTCKKNTMVALRYDLIDRWGVLRNYVPLNYHCLYDFSVLVESIWLSLEHPKVCINRVYTQGRKLPAVKHECHMVFIY